MEDIYIPRKAKSHVHGRPVRISNLYENLAYYWDDDRKHRAKPFIEKAIPFFKDIHSGKEFTDDELRQHPYYEYIRDGMKDSKHRDINCIKTMRDGIKLYHDVKNNGLTVPIEVWINNGKYNISRGTRRIVILYLLGKRNTVIRIYKNTDFMDKLRISKYKKDNSISGVCVKQFERWGWKATDKYWIHDYVKYYDRHCGHLINKKCKVIEMGVKRGGSVRLWQEAFPKAQVFGVDIDIEQARLAKDIDRITLLEGSQTDERFNKEVVAPLGPFDLIVDDASHIAEHQIKGFDYLWDSVKSGGWYVVEDLFFRNYHLKDKKYSFIDKLKTMIDDLNRKCEIDEIHFYYNIVFIKKR